MKCVISVFSVILLSVNVGSRSLMLSSQCICSSWTRETCTFSPVSSVKRVYGFFSLRSFSSLGFGYIITVDLNQNKAHISDFVMIYI